MTGLFSVLSVGEKIPYSAKDGSTSSKRTIVLQTYGEKYGDMMLCMQYGSQVSQPLRAGDTVLVNVKMQVREYEGRQYQDIVINALTQLSNNDKSNNY